MGKKKRKILTVSFLWFNPRAKFEGLISLLVKREREKEKKKKKKERKKKEKEKEGKQGEEG